MSETVGTTRPVILNERTRAAMLMKVGLYLLVACAGELAFALAYGWPNSITIFWPILWLVGWLSNTLVATEWTIEGRELQSRSWRTPAGSRPQFAMELGPYVECVHETRTRWRIKPNGPAIAVGSAPAKRLVLAMELADVRVVDWRGDWERRHRWLRLCGLIFYYGGAVAVFVAIAIAPLRPGGETAAVTALGLSLGAVFLGLAIDFLPWAVGGPSSYSG